jgi:hypothetical protein
MIMRVLTATFFMLLLVTGSIGTVSAQTATAPPEFNIRVGPISFNCDNGNNESVEVSISFLRFPPLDGDTPVKYDLVAYDPKGKKVFSYPVLFLVGGTGYAVISASDCNGDSAYLYVDGNLVTDEPAEGVVVAYRTRLNLSFKYHRDAGGPGSVGQDIVAAYYANENSFPPFVGAITTISTDGSTRAATGTVRWFNESKGFGFIAPSDGGKD